MIEFSEHNGAIVFAVRVVPRASKSGIAGEHDGSLKIRIAAPPVDGAANKELVRLLAETFKVAKGSVEIVSGQTSRAKQVRIKGVSSRDFLKRICVSMIFI